MSCNLMIFRHSTTRGMCILACIFMLLFSIFNLNAQQGTTKTSAFYPGFGIGFGFFYPKGVNEYISNDLSNYYQQYGTYDMFMYYTVNGFLTYKMKWFDVTALAEYAIAPKFILISNTSDLITYGFGRFSPGMLANFYVPFASGRHAVFFGGGAQYHMMKFKEFKRNTIGFRFQAGVSLQFRKFNVQPVLAFNLANAKDKMIVNNKLYDLSFTGGQLGINFSIHPPVAHR
jgi:hypothetical protein